MPTRFSGRFFTRLIILIAIMLMNHPTKNYLHINGKIWFRTFKVTFRAIVP